MFVLSFLVDVRPFDEVYCAVLVVCARGGRPLEDESIAQFVADELKQNALQRAQCHDSGLQVVVNAYIVCGPALCLINSLIGRAL